MGLSIYNIKKWYLMLTGRSILHVNQGIGRFFSASELAGYYNDLTEKVTRLPDLLDNDELPSTTAEDGTKVFFPVAVFQYGLGAYDMYLESEKKDGRYLHKFMLCAEWALDKQEDNGAWNNFFFMYPEHPYGAMAQGEGASLLLRAYKQTADSRFLDAAKKAIDYMLIPLADGGTSDGDIFMEYTHLPAVMNGWIFAWWGLYDFVLVTQDKETYKVRLDASCDALEKTLSKFSCNYWSMYDLAGHIASPFYHHLHIAQMNAMHQLTKHDIFMEYAHRWEKNEKNRTAYFRAFLKKAWQKIKE